MEPDERASDSLLDRLRRPVVVLPAAASALIIANLIVLGGGFFRALADGLTGMRLAPVCRYWRHNPPPPPDATPREAALVDIARVTGGMLYYGDAEWEAGLARLEEVAREGNARPVADLAVGTFAFWKRRPKAPSPKISKREMHPLEVEHALFHLERASWRDPENGFVHLVRAVYLADVCGRACEGEILRSLERAVSAPRFTDYGREIAAAFGRGQDSIRLPEFFKRWEVAGGLGHIFKPFLENYTKLSRFVCSAALERELAGDVTGAGRILASARRALWRFIDIAYSHVNLIAALQCFDEIAEAERRLVLRREGESEAVLSLGAMLARSRLLTAKRMNMGSDADWDDAWRATIELGWLATWELAALAAVIGFAATAALVIAGRGKPWAEGAWDSPPGWAVLVGIFLVSLLVIGSIVGEATSVELLLAPVLAILVPAVDGLLCWRQGGSPLPRPVLFLGGIALLLAVFPLCARDYPRRSAVVAHAFELPLSDRIRAGLSLEESERKIEELVASIEAGSPRYPHFGQGIRREPYLSEEPSSGSTAWLGRLRRRSRPRVQVVPRETLPRDWVDWVLVHAGTSRAHRAFVKLDPRAGPPSTTSPFLVGRALERLQRGEGSWCEVAAVGRAGAREAVTALEALLQQTRKRSGGPTGDHLGLHVAAALFMLGERVEFAGEVEKWRVKSSGGAYPAGPPLELLCACPTPEIERLALVIACLEHEGPFFAPSGRLPRIKRPELQAELVTACLEGQIDAEFLMLTATRSAAPALADALEERKAGRRAAEVILLLGRLGDGSAATVIERFLEDPDPRTRACAHVALGKLCPERRKELRAACAVRRDRASRAAAEITGEGEYGNPGDSR